MSVLLPREIVLNRSCSLRAYARKPATMDEDDIFYLLVAIGPLLMLFLMSIDANRARQEVEVREQNARAAEPRQVWLDLLLHSALASSSADS
jgi:hypothetical protein